LTDRDFTLNAIAVDLRGDMTKLIDPLNGEADLKAHLLRRCSPNALSHDPIRALRAVRQSIQLKARIEPETLRDIKAVSQHLSHTSPERMRDEFFKMLSSSKPWAALRVAGQLGLIAPILPQAADLPFSQWTLVLNAVEQLGRIFETISPARTDNTAATFGLGALVVGIDRFRGRLQEHIGTMWPNDRHHRALLSLALVLRAISAHYGTSARVIAERYAESLRLSNPERTRLEALLNTITNPLTRLDQQLDVLHQHRYWHKLGESGIDGVLLALAEYLADAGVRLEQAAWVTIIERARLLLEAYYERHDTVISPTPLVDGHQLQKSLKIKAGPMIRELLDMLREQQVLGLIYTRDEAIEAAQAYVSRLT
jgi:tRNA nucleotidyltransferase/poly(A) polymerase